MPSTIRSENSSPNHENDRSRILWALGERIKELTCLHAAARILQNQETSPEAILNEIVALLPPAWQYPEITSARIVLGSLEVPTASFRATPWMQSAVFSDGNAMGGRIDVAYSERRPESFEGPFLREERALIESLAGMLSSYFDRRLAEQKRRNSFRTLEQQVKERTADIERVNQALREEISERLKAENAIRLSQERLRRLAIELTLAEERERRSIAADLHDHIGQALAVIRMRIRQLQSNAVFSGMEVDIEEMLTLIDRTIQSTRTLTFEISPPILYDLGLEPALDWLCRHFREKHGLRVEMTTDGSGPAEADGIQITVFRSVQELLLNIVKHAHAVSAQVHLLRTPSALRIEVRDDGRGFDVSIAGTAGAGLGGFGLHSIRERMNYLGGTFDVSSSPGRGSFFVLSVPLRENPDEEGKP